jgi:hypothetical protein
MCIYNFIVQYNNKTVTWSSRIGIGKKKIISSLGEVELELAKKINDL